MFNWFQAKYLSQLSNVGVPGAWLFRVGHIQLDSIEEPDQVRSNESEAFAPKSCANGGNLRCHISAVCTDTASGFCCKCKDTFYGNGFSCIKNDAPLRVTGKLTGSIGDAQLNAQLQSYVVLADGRSYTAISPLDADAGHKSQLLAVSIGSVIGWLFAKPIAGDNAPNGYQVNIQINLQIIFVSLCWSWFRNNLDHRRKIKSHYVVAVRKYKRRTGYSAKIRWPECMGSTFGGHQHSWIVAVCSS